MRKCLILVQIALGAGLFGLVLSDTTTPRHPSPSVSIGLDSNEAPVALYNALGSRTITKAHRGVPSPKSEKTPYAHAIFHPIPSDVVYRDIIRISKIRKLDGVFIRRDGRVYEQWTVNLLGQNINTVRDVLG